MIYSMNLVVKVEIKKEAKEWENESYPLLKMTSFWYKMVSNNAKSFDYSDINSEMNQMKIVNSMWLSAMNIERLLNLLMILIGPQLSMAYGENKH